MLARQLDRPSVSTTVVVPMLVRPFRVFGKSKCTACLASGSLRCILIFSFLCLTIAALRSTTGMCGLSYQCVAVSGLILRKVIVVDSADALLLAHGQAKVSSISILHVCYQMFHPK